jgi:hypothetical protein
MAMLGEKLGGGLVDHSVGVEIMSGTLFLESTTVRSTQLMTRERLPRTRIAYRKHLRGIHGLERETYVSCWSSFPCRVYIDSNRHDYRI